MKAILIDDSPQARRLLKMMLAEFAPEIEILAEAPDATQAIELINKHKPDILFLDIEMPEKSGLQFAEELLSNEFQPEIIFITAYSEFAVQAFRLSAIDYLLKPLQEKDLQEAIEKVKYKLKLEKNQDRLKTLAQNLRKDKPEKLCLPVQNGYDYIDLDNIEYLEADGSYVHISLLDTRKITVSKNLRHYENLLEGLGYFIRVHRSFIVNKNHIKTILKGDKSQILMQSQKIIDIARDRKQNFWQMMEV